MRAVVVAAACVMLSACGSSPVAPDLSFRVIGQAAFPATLDLRRAEPAVVVIHDSGSWTDFLERSGLRSPSGRPEDPIPSINFSSEMSIVVLLGARPTSGYGIRADRISRRGAMLVVAATEIVSCATVLPVVTYPLMAIAVNRSDQTVAVEWSRETATCR